MAFNGKFFLGAKMLKAAAQDTISQVLKASLLVAVLFSSIALIWGAKAACGVAFGAFLGLFGLWLLNYMVPRILGVRRAKIWFWMLWQIQLLLLPVRNMVIIKTSAQKLIKKPEK